MGENFPGIISFLKVLLCHRESLGKIGILKHHFLHYGLQLWLEFFIGIFRFHVSDYITQHHIDLFQLKGSTAKSVELTVQCLNG